MVRVPGPSPLIAAFVLIAVMLAGITGIAIAASGPKFATDASFRLAYLGNLYNVPLDREARFAADGGPGERFDGMSGPSDLRIRLEGGASAAWRLARRRTLQVSGRLRYSGYAGNGIANHVRLRASARMDLTRRDVLDLRISYIPDRFKKNYKTRTIVGSVVETGFEPAHYRQFVSRLRYDRQWTKAQAAGISYQHATRVFDDPFAVRDRTTHTLRLFADRRLNQRTSLALGAGHAWASTPTEAVPGSTSSAPTLARDRSFHEISGAAELKMRLRRGWRAGVALTIARRDFATDNVADELYHGRTDGSWSVGAEVSKKLGRNLTLQIEGLVYRKTSDRQPSAADAIDEDVGYEGYVLGAGVTYTF